MDVRQYFKKIRDTEATLNEEFPLIVSLDTSDGGKAGAVIEVPRELAAKGLVDGWAALASEQERAAYFECEAAKKKAAQKNELSQRLQIAIISEPEFQQISKKRSKEDAPEGSR